MKQKPTAYFPNLVLEEGSISSQVYYAVRKAILEGVLSPVAVYRQVAHWLK